MVLVRASSHFNISLVTEMGGHMISAGPVSVTNMGDGNLGVPGT